MSNLTLVKTSEMFLSSSMYLILDNDSGLKFKLIKYPFENCQTFLISPFHSVFPYYKDCSGAMDKLKEIAKLCKVIQKLCQVDIKQELFQRLKPYIEIYTSMEYVNLTGFQMIQLLIKI